MMRTGDQRKADALAALERNGDVWLATANRSGRPHLIAVSAWWDGERLTIATLDGSRTARNLDSGRRARVAIGAPDDVVMIDARVIDSAPADDSAGDLAAAFSAAVGWDPREEPGAWKFFRLAPVAIQAYRGYSEQEGRDVMREGRWLA